MSKILVLHDDPETQLALVNTLEDAGHTAIPGTPGRDALEDVERWRYDTLVVDVLKRDVSAWYLMRRSQRARPGAKIVAICQPDAKLSPRELARLSLLHGADVVLTHPIDSETLWRAVAEPVHEQAVHAPLGA